MHGTVVAGKLRFSGKQGLVLVKQQDCGRGVTARLRTQSEGRPRQIRRALTIPVSHVARTAAWVARQLHRGPPARVVPLLLQPGPQRQQRLHRARQVAAPRHLQPCSAEPGGAVAASRSAGPVAGLGAAASTAAAGTATGFTQGRRRDHACCAGLRSQDCACLLSSSL